MMRVRLCFAASVIALVATDCATAQTPGDRFRKSMEGLKAYCANRLLGPGDVTCEPLSFKPADPLATPDGRLAHSIKLPPTLPARTYEAGMTATTYFDELCKEAGEFIFSSVKDVEGIMQLRPRQVASGQVLRHLYVLEDPYGHRDWQARNPEFFYVRPDSYRFLEIPENVEQRHRQVVRYYGYDGHDRKTMKREVAASPQSRYGFLWRGITRPNDREMGIAGGELIVIELDSRKVLAVKRGFARTGDHPTLSDGIWWRDPTGCAGDSRDPFASVLFVKKVLEPARP